MWSGAASHLRLKERRIMVYNLAQLLKADVGTSFQADIDEEGVQLDDDIKVIGPLKGHVRMRRVNQGLLVDGWVDLTLGLACNRCLKEFEHPMHVTFEEVFYPTVDVVTGVFLPAFDEEEFFPIYEHHQVDLTEAVRQNVLLAIPMVTLCLEDCPALCPQCGPDLSLGPSQCKPEVDTRLSILAKLLQNGSQA